MANQIRKNTFGSISGIISPEEFLAVELTTDQAKTISLISCSFRRSSANSGFDESAIAVFKGTVDGYDLAKDFRELENQQVFEYLRFFKTEAGFSESVYINVGKTDKISVLLFSPYMDGAAQAEYASLNVYGAFGNEKALFEVGK